MWASPIAPFESGEGERLQKVFPRADMNERIRAATMGDVEHLVHHRRMMFGEMGTLKPGLRDEVERASQEYFSDWGGRGF